MIALVKKRGKGVKRFLSIVMILTLVFSFSSCSSNSKESSKLTGSASEILDSVLEEAKKTVSLPAPLPPLEGEDSNLKITSDNCEHIIGLSSSDFDNYVSEAVVSQAAILTFAHEVILVKAKDTKSAVEVKKLAAEGYNPGKNICVFPDKCCVIDSGCYVLLVASSNESVDAVIAAFKTIAGNITGEADIFYEGTGDIGGEFVPK